MVRLDPERWKRARELFESSLDLPAGERTARLRAACGTDAELLAEVLALHESDRRSDTALEPPPRADVADRDVVRPGLRIGPYLLEERIGAGGMGSVWRARRADGAFEMQVAVKLVKRGMDTDAVLHRFRVERQVLADLDHPGVARLLDGGATAGGLPYLVMEHVRGVPLDVFCDERRLAVRDRLELFARVCSAVQHAHGSGIVHRDIKPGNVLVTPEGRPKLLDFGIAKILREDPEGALDLTSPTERMLTPEYASPEQIEGAAVTPAADVHGLGVVLFELLTGRRPFRPDDAGTGRIVDAVRQLDAPRPSAVVTRTVAAMELPSRSADLDREGLATRRGTSPRLLRAALEGDLDAIVSQALQKDPARRYPDAGALGDDVERHLRGMPVRARPERALRRALRFVRRHRAGVAIGVAVLVTLAVAAIVSATLYVDAEHQRSAAERNGYVARIGAALAALEMRDVVRARRDVDAAPPGLGGFELRHVTARIDRSARRIEPLDDALTDFVTDPESTSALVGGEDGTLALVDLGDLTVRRTWRDLGAIVRPAALDMRGGRAAVLLEDVAFVGLDLATGDQTWRVAEGRPRALAVDADGRRVACGDRDGSVALRALEGGRVLATWLAGASDVQALEFAPDGRRVASGTADGLVCVQDLESGSAGDARWPLVDVWDLAFDPSGAVLAVAMGDGRVARIELATRAVDYLSTGQHRRVASVAFSPDGRDLVAACYDRTIHVWSADGRERALLGHTAAVEGAVFRPGSGIVSIAQDHSLRTWPADADDVARWHVEPGWYMGLAIPPDGAVVVTSGGWPRIGEPCVAAWDSTSGRVLWSQRAAGDAIDCVAVDRSAARIATGGERGAWQLWMRDPGRRALDVDGHAAAILDLAFAPDGRSLATASRDGTVGLWDLEHDGRALGRLAPHADAVSSVRFAPDGERILTGCWDGTARVWSTVTRGVEVELAGHGGAVWQAVFDARGERVATASWDGTVRLWRAADGALLHVLRGHSGRVYCAGFSPDGTRLATGSEDRVVRLWDPERGDEVAALRGHEARVDKVAFTPDGLALFSLSIDGDLRRWDAPKPTDER